MEVVEKQNDNKNEEEGKMIIPRRIRRRNMRRENRRVKFQIIEQER